MTKVSMIEACQLLEISPATLHRWRKREDLNFPKARQKNQKELFFYKEEILNWKLDQEK
jgi:predicted DNA-binding transcriptional regulator AlpA